MRIARFAGGYGVVEGDVLLPVAGLLGPYEATAGPLLLDEVRLLAPVEPGKIVGFGPAYRTPRTAGDPRLPGMFLKPPTAVVGPGEPVRLPRVGGSVVQEGELAVVIGRACRGVSAQEAASAILGFTCANDVTAKDLPPAFGDNVTRSKCFDTSCPIGPWIETELDADDVLLTCTVNGVERQSARTSELLYPVAELVAMACQSMTLLPGDLVLTGTPDGWEPLEPGDEVAVTIEGIGTLANTVLAPA